MFTAASSPLTIGYLKWQIGMTVGKLSLSSFCFVETLISKLKISFVVTYF